MRKMFILPAFLLLAACAPAVKGNTSLQPEVMASPLSPVRIQPGETKFAEYTYPRTMISVNNKYFQDLKVNFQDRTGNAVSSPSAYAGWLKMKAADVPQGLEVSLVNAYIVKDVADTTEEYNQTVIQYREVIRVIYKITASPTVSTGFRTATVEFTDGVTPSEIPVGIMVGSSPNR